MNENINTEINFKELISLIQNSQTHDINIHFYHRRLDVMRNWRNDGIPEVAWAATGYDEQELDHNSTLFAIPFDMYPSELLGNAFDLEESEIGKTIKNLELQHKALYLQSISHQPNINKYEIKIFKISNRKGKLYSDIIAQNYIRENHAESLIPDLDKNSSGRVYLIGKLQINQFVFDDLKFYTKNNSDSDIYSVWEYYKQVNFTSRRRMHTEPNSMISFLNINLAVMLKVFNEISIKMGSPFFEKPLNNITTERSPILLGNNGKKLTAINLDDIEVEYDFTSSSTRVIYSDIMMPEFFKINKMAPLNIHSYISLLNFKDDDVEINFAHEYLPKIRNNLEITLEASLDPYPSISTKLIITKNINEEKKEEIFNEEYTNKLDELKEKWKKVEARATSLLKLTQVDLNYLSLIFIKKYFTSLGYSSAPIGHLDGYYKGKKIPIKKFFADNYGDYSSFFGEDKIERIFDRIFSINPKIYAYNNDRLETMRSLKYYEVTEISPYPQHPYINMYPKQDMHRFEKATNPVFAARKNLIILNDSNQKTAWKKKLREYLKLNSNKYNYCIVLDPENQIQSKLIEHLIGDSSHFVKYSDITKDITIEKKKKQLSQKVTFFDERSFTPGYSTISPKSVVAADDKIIIKSALGEPDKAVLVEFHVTKKEFYMFGNKFSIKEFGLSEISKIFKELYGVKVIGVSAANYKKFLKFGARPIEDKLNELTDEELFSIYDRWLYIPDDQNTSFYFHTSIKEIFSNFKIYKSNIDTATQSSTYNSLLKQHFRDIHYFVRNITPAPLKNLLMEMSIKTPLDSENYTPIEYIDHSLTGRHKSKALFDYIIDRIGEPAYAEDIKNAVAISKKIKKIAGSEADIFFNITDYKRSTVNLLKKSKYLNLTIEETQELLKVHIEDFMKEHLKLAAYLEELLGEGNESEIDSSR